MLPPAPLLTPDWEPHAPAGVGAAMSTRHGGCSSGPWASLNLGGACGDDAASVQANRQAFAAALGAQPVWLRQVHGTVVLRLDAGSVAQDLPAADAAWTTQPGLACCVLVADCLPVLLAARDGRAVAAAHAGWRGLAAGVLEATLQALQAGAGLRPDEISAWLGPSIGPQAFEVGSDVLAAFGQAPEGPPSRYFTPRVTPRARPAASADSPARWWANLPALAAARLQAAGVPAGAISQARCCTVSSPSDFFSFRRDGVTGRMAAAIWRR